MMLKIYNSKWSA